MSNAADLGSSLIGGNFTYYGLNNTIGVLDIAVLQGNGFQDYQGTANNQDVVVAENTIESSVIFQDYVGYAAAYDGVIAVVSSVDPNVNTETTAMDNQPVLTWPKDQQIYYKLVGYNTQTQTFETWVIVENIVHRTETFEPSGNFPNIDYNVFFTPPSGNTLSNIKIVGRWIQ